MVYGRYIIQYDEKRIDKKCMVGVGLEPVRLSLTQARNQRSNQLSHELAFSGMFVVPVIPLHKGFKELEHVTSRLPNN